MCDSFVLLYFENAKFEGWKHEKLHDIVAINSWAHHNPDRNAPLNVSKMRL